MLLRLDRHTPESLLAEAHWVEHLVEHLPVRAMVTITLVATLAQGAPVAPTGDSGRDPRVRARLAATLRSTDAALEGTVDPAEQGRLLANRGQALLALGQPEKARTAFIAALRKEPAIELDAARASPEALRVFDAARRELPATVSVALRNGSGAVTIDDRDLGPAPLQTQLAGGAHQLRAKAQGGRVSWFEAQVSPGRRVILELELDPPGAGRRRADASPKRVTEKWAAPVLATMELEDEAETPVAPSPLVERARETPVSPVPEDRPRRAWAFAVGAAGIALVGGGVAFGGATLEEGRLARAELAVTDAHALHASRASAFAVVSDVLYGAAVVAAAAAVWLYLSDVPRAPTGRLELLGFTSVPLPGGATFSLSGTF